MPIGHGSKLFLSDLTYSCACLQKTFSEFAKHDSRLLTLPQYITFIYVIFLIILTDLLSTDVRLTDL